MEKLAASLVSEESIALFHAGEGYDAYRMLGAHFMQWQGKKGVRFAVWAPHASRVRVVGSFNDWSGVEYELLRLDIAGIWVGFFTDVQPGALYKYELMDHAGKVWLKADPMAQEAEIRPGTASIVPAADRYRWADRAWYTRKRKHPQLDRAMLIYEVHLGSWKAGEGGQFRTYAQLAEELVDYVVSMHYTHIELMPLTEHPLDASWGYQTTGYFAATRRYGPPEGLKALVNRCHQRGIGVILDWVPGHFCKDDHGLRLFDGTPLYEDADPKRADKPSWGTLAFDFGKPQVQSFLIASAMYWLDVYHMDGIRVDAVAHMMDLHLDKPPEQRTFNDQGGQDNLEAISFLRKLNQTVHHHYPDALMIAEDSSSRPAITSPVFGGGLGFNLKWNMGWMNDILRYIQTDPAHRTHQHSLLTFSLMYAFSEKYILPFSHDEVVHGKRSLLGKMPGTYEEKFANLRLLLAYWIAHPGKKLLFMGGEFAQFDEWKDAAALDWGLLQYPLHDAMRRYVGKLQKLYIHTPSLWEKDHEAEGFRWIDVHNAEQCTISFMRMGQDADRPLIAMGNFSRCSYSSYRIGVPASGTYRLVLNSDEADYGGGGQSLPSRIKADPLPMHGCTHSIALPFPALSFLLLQRMGRKQRR